MSSSLIEFLLLAAIALFIGWRLYVTLGQDDGPPEGRERKPLAPVSDVARETQTSSADIKPFAPTFTGPAASGLEDIYEADNGFEPREFLRGARAAYEMIVAAYGRGDRKALKPLLDTDVYEAWDAAITAREKDGSTGMNLLRIKSAEITEADLDKENVARVAVQFDSELGDGETTARAREVWTFMRNIASSDPNWLLDDVDTAD